MIRYEITGATPGDAGPVLELAAHLNTVNLPNDRDHVERLLALSERSFTGQVDDPRHRKYVFILWDRARGRAVGTSTIVGQLGRRDAPYIYFDVLGEERYSRTLDRHYHHRLLRLGFSYDGPTEIGGLVVHPEERRAPERLGQLISYVRFLFIAMHRDWFRNEILAELLPPLEPDGTSHLWEALGRRFTGLSYAEADLLSSENKEFIRDLFPHGVIYASLLSAQAQAVIGKVGAQTRGVAKMLSRIGFRHADRIDPFDGGPHFLADINDITLVERTQRVSLAPEATGGTEMRALVARETTEAPFFHAIASRVLLQEKTVRLADQAVAAEFGIAPGAPLSVLPLS